MFAVHQTCAPLCLSALIIAFFKLFAAVLIYGLWSLLNKSIMQPYLDITYAVIIIKKKKIYQNAHSDCSVYKKCFYKINIMWMITEKSKKE